MRIDELNTCSLDAFVETLGGVFEHSPWIAQAVYEQRPFVDASDLHTRMLRILSAASRSAQIAVISAHPDLAGRLARDGALTPPSTGEQAAAGLDRLGPEERARFDRLNAAYRARFDVPFVVCAREHTKQTILEAMERRLRNDRPSEIATAIDEIGKIARLRLADIVSS